MPIYEFYCSPCNTIFTFYSKTVTVSKEPLCPRCKGVLKRQMSVFSMGGTTKGPENLPMSNDRIEQGMKRFTEESEKIKDRDPREAARMRENFSKMTGVSFAENQKKASVDKHENDGSSAAHDDVKVSDNQPLRDETLYEL